MSPVGFETTVSAGERPQTEALNRAATGTGSYHALVREKRILVSTWQITSTAGTRNMFSDAFAKL